MRFLICLIVGVLIGAMCAMTAANVLGQRNAWPRAVMTVMQHELGVAREGVRAGRCTQGDVASTAAHLKLLSSDIESALLAPGKHDRVFSQYADDLRREIGALDAPDLDCAARSEVLTKIGQACDACHRDYK